MILSTTCADDAKQKTVNMIIAIVLINLIFFKIFSLLRRFNGLILKLLGQLDFSFVNDNVYNIISNILQRRIFFRYFKIQYSQ